METAQLQRRVVQQAKSVVGQVAGDVSGEESVTRDRREHLKRVSHDPAFRRLADGGLLRARVAYISLFGRLNPLSSPLAA